MTPFGFKDFRTTITAKDVYEYKLVLPMGSIIQAQLPPPAPPLEFARSSPTQSSASIPAPSPAHYRLSASHHVATPLPPPRPPPSAPFEPPRTDENFPYTIAAVSNLSDQVIVDGVPLLRLSLAYLLSLSFPYDHHLESLIPTTDLTYRQILFPTAASPTAGVPLHQTMQGDRANYEDHPEGMVTFVDDAGNAREADRKGWIIVRRQLVDFPLNHKFSMFISLPSNVPPPSPSLPPGGLFHLKGLSLSSHSFEHIHNRLPELDLRAAAMRRAAADAQRRGAGAEGGGGGGGAGGPQKNSWAAIVSGAHARGGRDGGSVAIKVDGGRGQPVEVEGKEQVETEAAAAERRARRARWEAQAEAEERGEYEEEEGWDLARMMGGGGASGVEEWRKSVALAL
ncbi:hypothetical protein BCR35DRAFT_355058 [Leucosporidium creatinivorum]|uniref:Uncharacterized protein n=1 Tax=Leucosporidium creatinivorum TaxID=106004 RepID=A0A1Y2DWP7_9BASI|nr:hypothetical protein BCR35DRAFT_355058 [Leucosporidium creatinivorum]